VKELSYSNKNKNSGEKIGLFIQIRVTGKEKKEV
jgi:hypothetical protein